MSRYVNEVPFNGDNNALTGMITNFMTAEGFSLTNYNGQQIWKKGLGILAGPQYIAVLYGPNSVHIEAFIQFALFPGVYIGEMGTSGFFGAIPKQALASRVSRLEQLIFSAQNQQPAPPLPQQ